MHRLLTLFVATILTLPTLAEEVKFAFHECDFAHRSVYYHDAHYLPMLNDPLLVRAMLLVGADVNGQGGELPGAPPLCFAANADITRLLLDAGADVNAVSMTGHTPLFHAPDAESARLLIAAGADVNAENDVLDTPIFFARDAAITEVLLAAGARLTHYSGLTPLHTARDARTVELLIAAGTDPNARWLINDHPPLVFARNGEVARALIAAGADPLYKTDNGETLLFFARDADTVRQLLAAGVEVNAVSDSGSTALDACAADDRRVDAGWWDDPDYAPHFSLRNRSREAFPVAEALVAAGADVNHRDKEDCTPLMHAHDPRLVALLLDAGADAKFQSGKSGKNALFGKHNPESLRLLLAAGANVFALDMEGRSVLFGLQDAECVKILLTAGAMPGIRNEDGDTALHKSRDPACTRLLTVAGADPLAENKEGLTPLDGWLRADILAVLLEAIRQSGGDTADFLNTWRPGEKYGFTLEEMQEEFLVFQMVGNNWINGEVNDEPVARRSPCRKWERYTAGDFSVYGTIRAMLEAGMKPNLVNASGRTILYRVRKAETAGLLLDAGAHAQAGDSRGFTPLHLAVYNGAGPEAVKLLLEAGADVNAVSDESITPLMAWGDDRCYEEYDPDGYHASYDKTEQPEVVALLLAAGAKTDVRRKDGATPLHIYRHPESVKLLLAAGLDVNAKDDDGETPLHWINSPQTLRLLIAAGADVNAKNADGKTPMQSYGDDPEYADILTAAGATETWLDVFRANRDYLTWAAKQGQVEILERMAQHEGLLQQKVNGGATLLHHAGTPDAIRFLLAHGLDVNALDSRGNTPLHAIMSDSPINTLSVRLLLEAGADANAVNRNLETPLHCLKGRKATVAALLLRHGADVNARNNRGETPLLVSVRDRMTFLLLLRAGADIKATNINGDTVLHILARDFRGMYERYDVFHLALKRGLDINAVNRDLETPLHLCVWHKPAVRELMAAGANPYLQDLRGRAPIDLGGEESQRIMRGEEVEE